MVSPLVARRNEAKLACKLLQIRILRERHVRYGDKPYFLRALHPGPPRYFHPRWFRASPRARRYRSCVSAHRSFKGEVMQAQFLSTVTSTGVVKSTGYAGKNLRIYKAD